MAGFRARRPLGGLARGLSVPLAALLLTRQSFADCEVPPGEFGCVEKILEADGPEGKLTERNQSGRVWHTAAAQRDVGLFKGNSPVKVGLALAREDTLETGQARVIVKLGAGGRAKMAERTTLTMGDTFTQWAGNVWYEVRSLFSVRYCGVAAGVDGTTFFVHGGPARPSVAVEEGIVTVTYKGGERRVAEQQKVAVDGAELGAVEDWTGSDFDQLSAAAWDPGRSFLNLFVSGSAGVGMQDKRFTSVVRGAALLRLTEHWGVSADFGTAVTNHGRSFLSFGARYVFTPWTPAPSDDEVWRFPVFSTLGIDAIHLEAARAASPPGESRWGIGAASDLMIPVFGPQFVTVQGRAGVSQGPEFFWDISAGLLWPWL